MSSLKEIELPDLNPYKVPAGFTGIVKDPKNKRAWFKNGQYHREDGPAIISENIQSWYRYGLLHRLDGPAITWDGKVHHYYVNGVFVEPYLFQRFKTRVKEIDEIVPELLNYLNQWNTFKELQLQIASDLINFRFVVVAEYYIPIKQTFYGISVILSFIKSSSPSLELPSIDQYQES